MLLDELQLSFMADKFLNGQRSFRFESRQNRDSLYRLLKEKGYEPIRSTYYGQQLHPEYVDDYEGAVDRGFGNTQYKTLWSKLYCLQDRNE